MNAVWTPEPVKAEWLLDVDGVINADAAGDVWNEPIECQQATAGNRSFRLYWAPSLIDRIRALAEAGTVDIVWATTWCPFAAALEAAWSLPRLRRAWNDERYGPEAKAAKFKELERSRHRSALFPAGDNRWEYWDAPVIWTDDEWARELATSSKLYIQPDEAYGLTPADMDAIETFVDRNHFGNRRGYCMKCRREREFTVSAVNDTSDKNRRMISGPCTVCGTVMNRLFLR